MSKKLEGIKFGKLTVLNRTRGNNGNVAWVCKCDCGNTTIVYTSDLTTGHTKSCGCSHNGHPTHNMTYTPIYKIWKHMKSRCYNPHNNRYEFYGAKGITVCNKWLHFEGFYEDMGSTYSKGLSIDRINVNGNYEPSNCKWSTDLEQANNKTNSIMLTFNNETNSLQNLCRKYKLPSNTIKYRLKAGYTVQQAFKIPIITHYTKKLTLR